MSSKKKNNTMAFGYVPHKTPWKNAILRVLGNPNFIRRIQAPIIMRMLNLEEDDIVLDAGCGGGSFTYEIAKISQVIGTDLNINSHLEYAMLGHPRLRYLNGDVQNLPFEEKSFTKILLSSVLQMVEDDERALNECHRVLKDDGVLVLTVPIGYRYINQLNRLRSNLAKKFGSKGRGYSYDEAIKLIESKKFKIIEMEYAPKRLGSLIYESWLYFCYVSKLPLFSFIYFIIYPLAYFDKLDHKRSGGNEIIIKAVKI
ncbi:MAG: class I SAM-dependent methyltransferase [Candidatus Altiarchaeia archaeon]